MAPAVNSPVAENRRGAVELTPEAAAAEARMRTRQPKPRRDPDFVCSYLLSVTDILVSYRLYIFPLLLI